MKLARLAVLLLASFALPYRIAEIAQLPAPLPLAFITSACLVGTGICFYLLLRLPNNKGIF